MNIRACIVALLGILFTVTSASSGSMSLMGAGKPASVVVGYTGPIDINGAAYAFWSTRCGAAAYAGNILDIWDSATGSTTQTVLGCDGAGNIVVKSGSALATTCSVACRVKTIYDQSGSTNCGGSACDLSSPANAGRPTLNTSLLSGKIGMVFSTACLYSASTATVQTQPTTQSAVFNMTSASVVDRTIMGNDGGNLSLYTTNGTNAGIYAGGSTGLDTPISVPGTHAEQSLFKTSTASTVSIDGTTVGPGSNVGTIGIPGGEFLEMGNGGGATPCNGGASPFVGNIFEVGIWAADKSANTVAMNSNQHTYWGF